MATSKTGLTAGRPCAQHVLTFDVEDWHRGLSVSRRETGRHLEKALTLLLHELERTGTRATFFVLGEDAEKIRFVLMSCASAGHEIASHGMRHTRVDSLDRAAFMRDLSDSFSLIEDIVQRPCRGYRAPWFSLSPDMTWCFEALAERGAVYDSSLRMSLDASPPAVCQQFGLAEVSVPLLALGRLQIGVLGGLYLRVLPRAMIRRLLARCEREGRPGCLYLHPYEWLATDPPLTSLSMKTVRRRLYVSRALSRLRWVTETFSFTSIENWLQADRASCQHD